MPKSSSGFTTLRPTAYLDCLDTLDPLWRPKNLPTHRWRSSVLDPYLYVSDCAPGRGRIQVGPYRSTGKLYRLRGKTIWVRVCKSERILPGRDLPDKPDDEEEQFGEGPWLARAIDPQRLGGGYPIYEESIDQERADRAPIHGELDISDDSESEDEPEEAPSNWIAPDSPVHPTYYDDSSVESSVVSNPYPLSDLDSDDEEEAPAEEEDRFLIRPDPAPSSRFFRGAALEGFGPAILGTDPPVVESRSGGEKERKRQRAKINREIVELESRIAELCYEHNCCSFEFPRGSDLDEEVRATEDELIRLQFKRRRVERCFNGTEGPVLF